MANQPGDGAVLICPLSMRGRRRVVRIRSAVFTYRRPMEGPLRVDCTRRPMVP